jgi:BASS family bile acid:Na+ symporter
MDLKQLIILTAQVSILCTVVGFGLKTTIDDLLSLRRHPGLLVRSVLAVFVIMPIVAVLLVRLFDFRRTVEVALVALAISPMPPLLPQRKTRAGGDTKYALGLMAVLALLAIVVVPLALAIFERVFGRPVAGTPTIAVARLVLLTTLLPLATGIVVRATMPRLAASIEKPIALVAKVLLPLAIVALLVTAAPAMWALVGDGTLIAMVVFLTIGFASGHALGGPDPDHSVVLALSTACRHPAIALTIAAMTFPEERFGAAILLYVLLGFVGGIPYLAWQRRRHAQAAPPRTLQRT